MKFFVNNYLTLISRLRDNNYDLYSVGSFLQNNDSVRSACILRHDVDRRVNSAVYMAKAEHSLNIRSTYYFRCSKRGVFPSEAIRIIASLGHEVGYHYEETSRANGNIEVARMNFKKNLVSFRQISDCKTISMHGSPLSKYNNQDLTDSGFLEVCGLEGDAVASIIGSKPHYFTDTGGTWGSKHNLRDFLGEQLENESTIKLDEPDVFSRIESVAPLLYISTHPERWGKNWPDYAYCRFVDVATNSAKKVIRHIRS